MRQFCAQWLCLFLHRTGTNPHGFCDINAQALDDLYYQNLDFDLDSSEAKRFREILRRLTNAFGDGKRPKLKGYEVLHLILLTDALMSDYTANWEGEIAGAFDGFMLEYAKAKKDRFGAPNTFWTKYGSLARTNADKAETIAIRHEFFCTHMLTLMPHTVPKDPIRGYTSLEREIVYHRDGKQCALCDGTVLWEDAEVHHVHEHAKGGRTRLDNAVLVHSACHPKGERATKFAEEFFARKSAATAPIAAVTVEEEDEEEEFV